MRPEVDTIQLQGRRLFARVSLQTLGEDAVRLQVLNEVRKLHQQGEPIRSLRLRGRLAGASLPPPPRLKALGDLRLISAASSFDVVAGLRATFEGEASYFDATCTAHGGGRLPTGNIRHRTLSLVVHCELQDAPFLSAVIRGELDLINELLDLQREEIDALNGDFSKMVRRIIAETLG